MSLIFESTGLQHGIPDSLAQLLVETVPDLVLANPPLVPGVHPATLRLVNNVVRDAWCHARIHGYSEIFAGGDDGLDLRVGRGPQVGEIRIGYISTKTDYAYYTNSTHLWIGNHSNQGKFYNCGIFTPEVVEAYCLYKQALNDISMRIKNSVQTLINIFDDETTAMSGKLPANVMRQLDSQYEKSRRMYAPEGAKMTGVTVSLEGILDATTAFWIHLCRAAKISPWMLGKEEPNSSFTADHREEELTRLWGLFCEIPFYQILRYLGLTADRVISPPEYRTLTHRATRNDILATTLQRVETASKLEIGRTIEEHQLKIGYYDVNPREQTRTRSDLTKEDNTEIIK
jgi:hypothetical protein